MCVVSGVGRAGQVQGTERRPLGLECQEGEDRDQIPKNCIGQGKGLGLWSVAKVATVIPLPESSPFAI